MDHQWRHRPIQGSICPGCGFHHFPFCPPPPSFGHHNPAFHPPPAPQRPGFPPHPPHPWRSPADRFGDQRIRHGFPNPPMDPYGQLPIRPHADSFPPVPPSGGGGDGFAREADRSYKRMRVESRALADDERRLRLIRDHGGRNSFNGLEPVGLANEAPPAPNLVSGDKEASRFANAASSKNMPEDRFAVQPHSSLQSNDLSRVPGCWSGMSSLSDEHRTGISSGNFVANYPPPQPYRLPFPSNDLNHSFDGSPDPSGYRKFPPGITQYPAPSIKARSPPPPRMSSSYANSLETLSSYPSAQENLPLQPYHNKQLPNGPNGSTHEYMGSPHPLPSQRLSSQKPKMVDASNIFKLPLRASRPDHFVVILRGLPGSGKSYLAKMLRDLEVENGGAAPRIYSMDEYFMTEVEKVEEADSSKSTGTFRGNRTATKKVTEYCYEPEMEEAYRGSMLKAYSKTVEEGVFTFIIVDDRNLRVADFAQFWAVGKKSGYEVYILEASYKDPEGCAARNVHGFTLDDIQQMAGKWEEAPALYLKLDVKSLFHGDDLKEGGIQEVDMDMEDDIDDGPSTTGGTMIKESYNSCIDDEAPSEHPKVGERLDVEEDHLKMVRDLGQSKWSGDLEDHANESVADVKGSRSVQSSTSQGYNKKKKSVRWGDKGSDTGFSISAAKKSNSFSLEIGPGAGYNLKSNPLPKEVSTMESHSSVKPRKQSVFQEQLKAERESFKAVFDRRRHRIGGLQPDE